MHSAPVLLIAHGQPSAPAAAAADLAALAQAVAAHLPTRSIASVTLAETGGLARALAALGPRGFVFPMFMAGGWFTRSHLAGKIAALTGGAGWQMLPPFGCLPALHDLAEHDVAAAIAGSPHAPEVLIAAHGSGKSAAPAAVALALAARLKAKLNLSRCEARLIEHSPLLAEATGFAPHAICLPFFAAAGGHVTQDIPAALAAAGFAGRVLPPLGTHPEAPALIACAIAAGQLICTTDCRYTRAR